MSTRSVMLARPTVIRKASCVRCGRDKVFIPVLHDWFKCADCGQGRSIDVQPYKGRLSVWDRFWRSVKVTPFCWSWMRTTRSRGGLKFQIDNRSIKVARVAYFLLRGTWPDGVAFRSCGNGACVKPDHIIDIPQSKVMGHMSRLGKVSNIRQKIRKECKRGHRMIGYNIYTHSRGRNCRKCMNANHRAWYAKGKLNEPKPNVQYDEPQSGEVQAGPVRVLGGFIEEPNRGSRLVAGTV